MVGILVVSHGGLAEAMVRASELIAGKSERVEAVSLEPGVDMDAFNERFCSRVRALDDGSGVLVLADMYAGTPCNVAARTIRGLGYECVSGANLAMLIEAISMREGRTAAEIRDAALESARESIRNLREIYQ